MTLSNGLLTDDAAFLWSDTAWWDDNTGEVAFHAPKIILGTGFPFALVTTGIGQHAGEIAQAIDAMNPQGFDELVWLVRDELERIGPGSRVLIAAFEKRPRLMMIATDEYGGHPPLTFLELGGASLCSGAGNDEIERLVDDVTPDNMIEIIRLQHAGYAQPDAALIAGDIGRVRVDRTGIHAEKIGSLPDPKKTGA